MKVDGLTNDEVKSHLQVYLSLSLSLCLCDYETCRQALKSLCTILTSSDKCCTILSTNILIFDICSFFSFCTQKYRLHTRRPSPSPQVTGAAPPQLVVLGGIWVPEYATAAAAHSGASALYGHGHPGSHAPQHYCASPVPQDYYAAAQPPPPPHHQLHHHTLHHQLHVYKAASQAHSSPESDIRGTGDRSESIEDGKSDSSSWKGESGERERKGLCALREDGEESNGSGITLKF